ncbi:hypothetical protein [Cellvibrio mixtus]|uniref:hypothetical protein n=1 Tax=Cellvibrio mixtus TaxID=39650 RepID=UPI0005870B6C|nr:hypothetical protein [Cellvibrio mixtus]
MNNLPLNNQGPRLLVLSLLAGFRYALLFFKLLFPLRILRWTVVLIVVLWGTGWILEQLYAWDFLIVLAIAITVLMTFIFLTLIPNQFIALASSRPVGLLGNTRHTLLICLLVLASLINGVLYGVLSFSQELSAIQSLPLVIWLLVSLLLQLCVLVCSRWPNGQGVIFILAWVWLQFGYWLAMQNPLLLLLGWLASWFLFSRWWLVWQPKKYLPNSMVAVINDAQQLAVAKQAGFLFRSGKADTWLGSRFFGAPDGWHSRRQRLLVASAFFLVAPIPAHLLMGEKDFAAFMQYALILFVMFMAATVAHGMAINFALNLRNVWLCCPGGRQHLLSVAWKLYAREIGIWTLVNISLALAIEFIWGQWHGVEIWLYAVVFILLINAVSFFLVLWIYQRTQGSLPWCNWVCGFTVLLWMVLFIATGLLFPLPFNWAGITAAWIWLPPLMLLVLLYSSVRADFSRMDLVRMV